jgi:hypothetical protein
MIALREGQSEKVMLVKYQLRTAPGDQLPAVRNPLGYVCFDFSPGGPDV